MIVSCYVQMDKGPAVDRTAGFAELRRQLDVADADIVLVNKRLDEAHDMCCFVFFVLLMNIKRSMMLVSIICCGCRWCCCHGGPSGGTCPSQGTSQDK